MKSILQEIVIVLLLCVVIVLLLCVIFYNYIPINKTVPSNVEAYVTSDTIKNEIEEEIVEYPKENIVFEITDSDLTLYKQSNSYVQGKSNPFTPGTTSGSSTDTSGGGTIDNSESGNNSSGSSNVENPTIKDTPLK